jgi:hypothetical protein
MLKQVRELEKELKLEPINLNVFGDDAVTRAKSIKYYLLGLIDLKKNLSIKKGR